MPVVPFRTEGNDDSSLPLLLSIPEVCEYLGLGKTTVREMINRREIPHIRVRSRIRVLAEDLKKYLEKNRK